MSVQRYNDEHVVTRQHRERLQELNHSAHEVTRWPFPVHILPDQLRQHSKKDDQHIGERKIENESIHSREMIELLGDPLVADHPEDDETAADNTQTDSEVKHKQAVFQFEFNVVNTVGTASWRGGVRFILVYV